MDNKNQVTSSTEEQLFTYPVHESATNNNSADIISDVNSYVNNMFDLSNGSARFVGNAGSSNENGVNLTFSFTDLMTGYSYFSQISDYFSNSYNLGYYADGNSTVTTRDYSEVSSSSSYTQSTLYPVGNRNGYIQNLTANKGTLFFIDSSLESFERKSDFINFNMGNGTSFQAQTSSSENDIVRYTTDGQNVSYAKIGYTNRNNDFSYQDGINFYSGGEHLDTLKVSTYDSKNIWLDGSQGILYSNIDNIDASDSYGDNQLAGNSGNNTIQAGNGNDLLWGQAGDDILIGGAGQDTFYYGVNEGNDVIRQSVSTDKVNLYNVSLTDIVSADVVGQNFVVNMAGGESLVIEGENGASNFVLADKSEYHYNRYDNSWTLVQ